MTLPFLSRLASWLPKFNRQVWILASGRFLSELGTGFTLFYAPIFFVNQLDLSTTAVGLALGSASISGIFGRILGGYAVDSSFWGRRRTLLLSAAISAVGSFVLAASFDFVTLIIGNLIGGMGAGLYWPATEAVVADITQPEHQREAFALNRLADNLGLGMGIVLGGILVVATKSYRALFAIDAISFVLFFGVIFVAIQETYRPQKNAVEKMLPFSSWMTALGDRRLQVFISINIILTTYISQLQSTLPVYFKNYIPGQNGKFGFTETIISGLFTWHLILAVISQLPVAKILNKLSHARALMVSSMLWAVGFILIWRAGISSSGNLYWAAMGLAAFALAIVSYTPSASALISDIAPSSQRGVYFSLNSLCWAVGYFIGPPLGGWVLDKPRIFVDNFWLGLALSTSITIVILRYLGKVMADVGRNRE
ncbi:MFS transporter [Mastigocoleus sp. MO_188.B34]|uniref:MDR family MFS transporter n=1 Tax=Mastigocoleus sp. MO_188.B34 TaxID=3036635 RepID=UPI002633B1C3|nr:MFS transporter [Mastigocoleus sp. MO_188.B34]MDJ0693650.1 MFS transporter [Mastigocoleus sp. MO_188.B34]